MFNLLPNVKQMIPQNQILITNCVKIYFDSTIPMPQVYNWEHLATKADKLAGQVLGSLEFQWLIPAT